MTEVLPTQNEQREPRPIGRFLLGLEGYAGQNDPLSYAGEFAHRPGNFQKYKHRSATVGETNKDIVIDNREVTLQFSIARTALVWTVTIAAEQHTIDNLSTGYIPHGGEQYELHCATPKSFGVYREYDMQRRVSKQKEFDTAEVLNQLQGLVESLLDTGSSDKNK